MALASTNPIRLADTHLMCTGEFLVSPPAMHLATGLCKKLGWLSQMPFTLNGVNPPMADTEVVTSLVVASVGHQVRTGLVLRLRMLDEHATPQQCEAARENRMDAWEGILRDNALEPVRPLASEGVYALLPREGLRFLRRATDPDGAPIFHEGTGQISLTDLEQLVAAHPGSGLCITLFPRSSVRIDPNALAQETLNADCLIATWGMAADDVAFIKRKYLPLAVCPEVDPADRMTGFHFLYDPWEQIARIRKQTGQPALTATGVGEMTRAFGFWQKPAAPQEEPYPTPVDSPVQMARGMMKGLTGLRQQMRATTQAFSSGVKAQVTQAVAPQLAHAMQQMTDLPGVQQQQFSQALDRISRLADSMTPPELAAEARTAGLDTPIDSLLLLKMGFSREQELLDGGLTPELLTLLRSALHLRQQCPDCCADDANCITYAFMVGYLYEALINRCFVPLFKVTGGNPNAHFLSDYTKVNEAHMQRLAEYAGKRDRTMRSLTADDWTAWMTLCNMIRSLRNRQHSDRAVGFVSHGEMAAAHEVFFFKGHSAKTALTRLPAFSAERPAWSKEFNPGLPAAWGATTNDQRNAVARHIVSRVSAFSPSLLQFLLRCGTVAAKEDPSC